jgi:hypothetical protein
MRCEKAIQRGHAATTRALAAVLVFGLACACDSGSFGSHSDRGPPKLAFTTEPTGAVAGAAMGRW